MTRKTFDEMLLEAVDEALASLGDSAKQSIYFHLKDKFQISRSEVPHRTEEFANGLERIFGVGAKVLEVLIMKNLYDRVGRPLKWDESRELVFAEYVAAARSSLLKRRKRT